MSLNYLFAKAMLIMALFLKNCSTGDIVSSTGDKINPTSEIRYATGEKIYATGEITCSTVKKSNQLMKIMLNS